VITENDMIGERREIRLWKERREIHDASLYLGEAMAVLSTLPDASVDAIFTDPPYSSGGFYRADRLQDVHTKYVQTDSESGAELSAFQGDARDQFGYWFWLSVWLSHCQRIAKPGSIAGLFTDWRQLSVTIGGLQSAGLIFRGVVPWHKPGARPTQGRFSNSCEYLVWGTYGPRQLEGNAFPGFFNIKTPRGDDRVHITQKPVELMESLVRIVPDGGAVLDPFMGSGTTGVACATLGRRFVGIELEPAHFTSACERIDAAYAQGRLFP
jgi:site-specific DNA-methyltransferase (adenine-specific)